MKNQLDPISVVICVYNEAETIENEIRKIYDVVTSRLPGSEFIVAEDGSTDGTKEIIHRLITELGIVYSTSDERKGYAQALRDAFLLAKCEYIFFTDTGNKHAPEDFWKLYPFRKDFGIIVGAKENRTDQMYRRILTWGYNRVLSWYFKVRVNDADSGFRIYQRAVVDKVFNEDWINKDLIGSEIILRASYSGFQIKEVPISYTKRKGESRGLPLKGIPGVIFRVLGNFSKLRSTLTKSEYRLDKMERSNDKYL